MPLSRPSPLRNPRTPHDSKHREERRLPIRLARPLSALIALVVLGVAAAVVVLLNSPTPAQAAAEAIEKRSAAVTADLAAEISPRKPLVIILELFQKGGYKTADDATPTKLGDYITVYPERVLSKIVLTPDPDGNLASVTEDISAVDGSPPLLISLLDGSELVGPAPTLTDGGTTRSQPPSALPDANASPAPAGTDNRANLAEWLDAQLELPLIARKELGYAYAGRSIWNGQPSIRYERRSAISTLPNGQAFNPPLVLIDVLEFVEANPLLGHESRYTVTSDGKLVLESQTSVVSISAGEPAEAPGAPNSAGG